jgi:hypothetical protein
LFWIIIFATWSIDVCGEQHAGSGVITSRAFLAIVFSFSELMLRWRVQAGCQPTRLNRRTLRVAPTSLDENA